MQKSGDKCNPEFGSIPWLLSNLQGRNGDALNFVIDKVQKKLNGWQTKFLSKVGKLVLAKTTTTSIVEYYMQCHALPIKVSAANKRSSVGLFY